MRFMVSARAEVARCQSSGFAGVIFRMRFVPIGKFNFEIVEAEIFHNGEGEIDAGFDFGFDLIGRTENVRVVLREATHAEKTVKNAAAFVAMTVPSSASRLEIAVTVELCL